MSPSRGLLPLFQNFPRQYRIPSTIRSRTLSTFASLSTSKTPLQIYISRSNCPYSNLSIEHHLFKTTPENSTVLFLYSNTPSIVIGRNQNPWVEVNLPLLHRADGPKIDLVRRRSGGGTVFHDLGNVNYSVSMPSSLFARDKHAEMVVRALHELGVKEATVNKRHDIVLLPPGMSAESTKMEEETPEGTRKISGSAFKLTRLRSYHHGTMLLDSRLDDVRSYLRSPAKGWLKARGVDSVRSPVANVGVGREAFISAVVREFGKMYLGVDRIDILDKALNQKDDCVEEQEVGVCYVCDEELDVKTIGKGIEELKSPKWIYGQTPQLIFSVPPPPESSAVIEGVEEPPENSEFTIMANKGIIELVSIEKFPALNGLIGKRFDGGVINDHISKGEHTIGAVGSWIEGILGRTKWGSSD